MLQDPNAPELRAVAPLIALGETPRLIGPITIVANGARVIGVTSVELLRTAGADLAVVTRLDGSATVGVRNWNVGRYAGVGLVELDGPIPIGHDVAALAIASVHASVNVHGASAALVTIEQVGSGYERSLIPVYVDADDAGGMSDSLSIIASPFHPAHIAAEIEGAAGFAWLPPEPALGRRGETVAFGMAIPYRAGIAKPRATPVIAELFGLEDLGRALIKEAPGAPGTERELGSVAGEIGDDDDDDPLTGL